MVNDTTCPNERDTRHPTHGKHKESLRLEGDRIFLNYKNPGQGDIFAVLWKDSNRNTEVFWEKKLPNPQGYGRDQVRGVLVWCERCNRDGYLKPIYEKALSDLLQRVIGPQPALTSLGGGSISTNADIVIPNPGDAILNFLGISKATDYFAWPGFAVWPHGEADILNHCWNRGWWEVIANNQPAPKIYAGLEEEGKREVAEHVTKQRFDRREGRRKFIAFFSDPKYSAYIRKQIEDVGAKSLTAS